MRQNNYNNNHEESFTSRGLIRALVTNESVSRGDYFFECVCVCVNKKNIMAIVKKNDKHYMAKTQLTQRHLFFGLYKKKKKKNLMLSYKFNNTLKVVFSSSICFQSKPSRAPSCVYRQIPLSNNIILVLEYLLSLSLCGAQSRLIWHSLLSPPTGWVNKRATDSHNSRFIIRAVRLLLKIWPKSKYNYL